MNNESIISAFARIPLNFTYQINVAARQCGVYRTCFEILFKFILKNRLLICLMQQI